MNVLPNYRVGIVGGLGVEPPPQFMSTDAHFWVKIGHKLQTLGKISNISASDPPVLLGQFQHCPVTMLHSTAYTADSYRNLNTHNNLRFSSFRCYYKRLIL